MLRWLILLFAIVLLGAVAWSIVYQVTPAEAGKIGLFVFLFLALLAYLIIRNRSRRKPPPPPEPRP